MLLRHSLGLEEEADAVERAIADAIASGARTGDIAAGDQSSLSTIEMTAAILAALD